jgi:mRNA-degrading endonuclease toxin of MazEF toxin-antitoxin module
MGNYRAGEVWFIPDEDIRLHEEGREVKNSRPAIIVMSEILLNADETTVNIIPCSSSCQPDLTTFPVARGYSNTFGGFLPHANSHALIRFYQPIASKYLLRRIGELDETTYNAIVEVLCREVVGQDGFDFGP